MTVQKAHHHSNGICYIPYATYDILHIICWDNEIPKALEQPESTPMTSSCSFINEKQIKEQIKVNKQRVQTEVIIEK